MQYDVTTTILSIKILCFSRVDYLRVETIQEWHLFCSANPFADIEEIKVA